MSVLSRADLLIALYNNQGADKQILSNFLGFEYIPHAPAEKAVNDKSNSPAPKQTGLAPGLHTLRRPVSFWYLANCKKAEKITASALEPVDQVLQQELIPVDIPMPALQTDGQWQNCWDKILTKDTDSRVINLDKAVEHLAKSKPAKKLPRRQHKRFNQQVVLLMDYTASLRPVWDDLRQLPTRLQMLLGKDRCKSYYLRNGPLGVWWNSSDLEVGDFKDIHDKATVIIVGAFGGLLTARVNSEWGRLIQRCQKKRLELHCYALLPLRGLPKMSHHLQGSKAKQVDTLLTALSQAWRPSLEQLRMLRKALPGASLLDELKVYNNHEVTATGDFMQLKTGSMLPRLKKYQQLDQRIQHNINTCVTDWQDSLSFAAQEIENLQQHLFVLPNFKKYAALHKLAADNKEIGEQDKSTSYCMLRSMGDIAELLPNQTRDASWNGFLTIMHNIAKESGKRLPMQHQGLEFQRAHGWLQQCGDALIRNVDASSGLMPLSSETYCQDTGVLFTARNRPGGRKLNLIDHHRHWQLRSMEKPRWAQRIWRNNDGLFAAHEDGVVFQMLEASEDRAQSYWHLSYNQWEWAQDAGVDEYGLWAEMQVTQIRFRMRWIAAGNFLMGSPEDEPGHNSDETQHKVTLSRGYWLAETACTQALWQSITNKNPSHFKGDLQRPVETVSWNDCRQFIKKLNSNKTHGFQFKLPTEAEWEYACRAGTQTAFSFGGKQDLDNTKVNYSGKWNDVDLDGETKSVDSYAPNNWGLHQMHGNIWEWCADNKHSYSSSEVVDPIGSKGSGRVLRGGSWSDGGHCLRSAYRNFNAPDYRYHFTGLRLAGGVDPQASKSTDGLTADRWPRGPSVTGSSTSGIATKPAGRK